MKFLPAQLVVAGCVCWASPGLAQVTAKEEHTSPIVALTALHLLTTGQLDQGNCGMIHSVRGAVIRRLRIPK